MRRAAGFTLVELVLVMLIISAGLLGIASLFSNNSTSLTVNEDSQSVAQYAQECAEHVMAVRRDLGFISTSISTTMCDSSALGTLPSGFTRALSVPATYTGTSTGPCPNGATCRDVTVTVTNGGTINSAITLMLVDY